MGFIKITGKSFCLEKAPKLGQRFLLWTLLAFLVLTAGQVPAQTMAGRTFRAMGPDELRNEYDTLMATDGAWKALVQGAASMGYALAGPRPNASWGVKGTLVRGGKAVAATWVVFDLDKSGSPNPAALQYVSNGHNAYWALDMALSGNPDPDTTVEYTVVQTSGRYQMEAAHGLWYCLGTSMRTACEGPCAVALTDCKQVGETPGGNFSWAAYVGCLSDHCDACAVGRALTCALH
jgi:hypothetical protein